MTNRPSAMTALATVILAATCVRGVGGSAAGPLRVCADPNNLPFSNARQEGFENRLADMLARDLHTTVQYHWWPQRRGFLRNTLNAERCDVVMGVPAGMERLATTSSYYRSTYVFVTRRARHLELRSLDDPRLRRLRIGVPLIGDDGANAPPAHALARRGIVSNVVGYSVLGDYRQPNPPAALVDAVARGDVDVATVWGPVAGYFASRASTPLEVRPISAGGAPGQLPIIFAISMGVRRADRDRLAVLNAFIARRHTAIDAILSDYHVPRVAGREGK
jgi:mxaJ protein